MTHKTYYKMHVTCNKQESEMEFDEAHDDRVEMELYEIVEAINIRIANNTDAWGWVFVITQISTTTS